jgi:hypothetical protein
MISATGFTAARIAARSWSVGSITTGSSSGRGQLRRAGGAEDERADGVERYPDFTAEDPATGITVYWEHLGMLSDPTYVKRWDKKLEWYKAMSLEPNGPENGRGERLVTSQNRKDGAIDSAQIRRQVRDVFEL